MWHFAAKWGTIKLSKRLRGELMHISKLYLENFRCYDKFEIDFDDELTVIVAENGQGKTAILDALAIAMGSYLSCFSDAKARNIHETDVRQTVETAAKTQLEILRMKSQYPVIIGAEGEVGGEKISWQRELNNAKGRTTMQHAKKLTDYGRRMVAALRARDDNKAVLPVIAYYGTGRIWKDSRLRNTLKNIDLERSSGYADCLESTSSYASFGHWVKYAIMSAVEIERIIAEKQLDEPNPYKEVFKAVEQAIVTCIGSMGWTDIDYSFVRQNLVLKHKTHGILPIEALSDGARSVISMVADLSYRMVRLNPDLGINAVLQTPGVVMIDEVDMHLHPSWQQTVLSDLRKAFPLVQFIVTTHSPQVLTTVPPESIRALRWDNGLIDIYQPEFSLGAQSVQLLKDIQCVDARPQNLQVVQELQRYLDLVAEDEWDCEEALALRKKLDKWAAGREPALLRADMDIRMRAFRRKRHEKNI